MKSICGLPPIVERGARRLILGSMPGAASLAAQQYYAHPRNAFWPIMGALYGFDPSAPYADRVAALKAARVAVWDVLRVCRRSGSLDSNIAAQGVEPNDFAAFFRRYPTIARVYFNGGTAERYFRRLVSDDIDASGLVFTRLPSTSPAHAARRFEQKLESWRVLIRP